VKEDETGSALAELLMRKAREGVRVRVLYDWMGAVGKTTGAFWRRMRAAGVDVRCFNRPRLASPIAWIRRDHRKLLGVDGQVAFVSGLCVGQDWVGWPERDIEPWRDTGVALRGPAVADVEHSFAESWGLEGEALPAEELPAQAQIPRQGDQELRVIATTPETTGILRLDLLWCSVARERLWIADAYFVGTPPYLGALASAARSGVDVRLLVPSASDIALIAAFSHTQYRPLLEAGVRVFEWNGSMMHAKTAVVDGHWSRVGSTNLNLASWIGNWELDVCVDDEGFGAQMEAAYLRDLEGSTEMVLELGRKVLPGSGRRPGPRERKRQPGSASRATAAALEIGSAFGAAVSERGVAPAEARSLAYFGAALLVLALVAFFLPRLLTIPLGLVAAALGIGLLLRARAAKQSAQVPPPEPPP
jgi:cardiolipin synthase